MRAEIRRRAAEPAEDTWTLAQGPDGIYVVDTALKPIDHPFCRWHVVATVDRGIEQLAGTDELPALDAAESDLAERLTAYNRGRS